MQPIVLFGGKFPLSGGVPAIYIAADIEECCCPAPCECPCASDPATSWPCGGLLESYVLTAFFEEITSYDSTGCVGSVTSKHQRRMSSLHVTVTATGGCFWGSGDGFTTAELPLERRDWDTATSTWGDWYSVSSEDIGITLDSTFDCKWKASRGFGLEYASKFTGATPAGNYKLDVCASDSSNSSSTYRELTLS
jgi:hypothetical protein